MIESENSVQLSSPLQGDRGSGLLGIRHHGPGSARAVRAYLEAHRPDLILVEGPPEADGILQWITHEELKPPLAILCYNPDAPKQSVFYPFAEFSPEWQAILFAKQNNIPVRFFDLPIAHQFALDKLEEEKKETPIAPPAANDAVVEATPEVVQEIRRDPIAYLAEAAGYEDSERWWEQMFEYRQNSEQVFEAVAEAMQSLREHVPAADDHREKLREAHMRKMMRAAEKELYTNVAVVCGAWHVPALLHMPKQKEDNDLLKGLPKSKVECTWVPWTYNRLSFVSGYGAGIYSPGWYEHSWHFPSDDGTRWMSKVAQLFRKKGMDTSVAHVIEAVRLSETLVALRGYARAGLEELNEATLSVLCNGESIMMQLIHDELIVSNTIGEVPASIPKPPLQMDIEKQQKTLRLTPTADFKDYTLDLRKETDLARSVLLHRLRLLGIDWGEPGQAGGKGTFKEQWRLQWDPSFSVAIIEKGVWGNTVEEAANKYLIDAAEKATAIHTVAARLEEALPANLHAAVDKLIERLNALSAASADVVQLMEAVPPLVTVVRYGNVRNTDAALVLPIVRSMLTRICIGLPNAVTGIDEEAVQKMLEAVGSTHDAVTTLQEEALTVQWQQTLQVLAVSANAAAGISGYANRLLADYKLLEGEALTKAFHYRMSIAFAPGDSAAWLEGFLKGSGSILLVDADLWNLVNEWVKGLDKEIFTQVLPLLRRTFSNFTPPERKKLGEQVKRGGGLQVTRAVTEMNLDAERAKKGIPVVLQLLGV